MRKDFTQVQLLNGRWRGIMPFRTRKACTSPGNAKLLSKERRTSEPSPFNYSWVYPEGHGKARGSYTERMRQSLWEWMRDQLGNRLSPLTFEYRLYRHKIITIVGDAPYIRHNPNYGKSKKGFILEITVLSIDGTQCRLLPRRRVTLAWDRIIGKDRLLALPEAPKEAIK